jgi:hypothetical protein
MKQWVSNLKYKFDWMRVYFSPFKPILPKLYIGEVAIGTPYFYPRKWINNPDKPGYMIAVPKKIGFDFVEMGWKTKWDSYRHEWNPIWSFVFFKWQIALVFEPKHDTHYWECWLYYSRNTKGTTKERLEQARKEFPCVWVSRYEGEEVRTCYWDKILKNK